MTICQYLPIQSLTKRFLRFTHLDMTTSETNSKTNTVEQEDKLLQQDLSKLDVTKLTPLTPEVISRQATINIGK